MLFRHVSAIALRQLLEDGSSERIRMTWGREVGQQSDERGKGSVELPADLRVATVPMFDDSTSE